MVGWRRRSFVLRFHKPKRLRKQCSSGGRRVNLLSWQNQSFIKWITVWQSLFWYRHTERQTDPEDPAGTHLSRDRLSCAGARQACEFQIIKSHCVRTLQHSCITSADVLTSSCLFLSPRWGMSPVTSFCPAGTSLRSKACRHKPFSKSPHRMLIGFSPKLTGANTAHTCLRWEVWPEGGARENVKLSCSAQILHASKQCERIMYNVG